MAIMNPKIIVTSLEDLSKFLEDLVISSIKKVLADQDLNSNQNSDEFLNTQQVAEFLHTTPQNIHAKKRAGKLPYVQFGSRILFKRSEVIASLESTMLDKPTSL